MQIKLLITSILLFTIPASIQAGNEIVINEIMYNSSGTDVEYIELYNNSPTAYNLQNWYILDDNDSHNHCIINWTLQPGQYLVIAGDVTQFQQKYPGVAQVNPNGFDTGGAGWSLGNGGDIIRLYDNTNALHDQVAYDDGGEWPTSPDGNGPSLELLHPALDNSLPTSWDPGATDNGTPGAQNSVFTTNVQPTCKDGNRSVDLPTHTDDVLVTVLAYDNEGLDHVDLFVNTGQGFVAQPMFNDGTNGDLTADDLLYSAIIPSQNSNVLVKYYAMATDDIGQQDKWPNNAPVDYHAYTVDYLPPKLRITELLAVNNSVNTDAFGEYDDWFEIHNAGSANINLGGMYVSNSLGSSKSFELPQVNLAQDEYIIIWADNDTEQGALHVDFKLSSTGEAVALFETVDHGNVLIHGWKYGVMSSDVSMGFKPEDGTAPEYLTSPSPGASNESSELFSPVCINEFQSTSGYGGPDDWVEIYNRGAASFDLSGCFLSDQRGDNTKWTFPQGSVLQPGEFLVVYEDALGFGFASEGDDVIMLTASDSTTGLDFYDFKEQQADKSEGRFPDGINTWQLFDDPTKGYSNFQATEIEENQNAIPNEFILHQNYPNPFNPTTAIHYTVPVAGVVELTVYNIFGQEVKTIINEFKLAGSYRVTWDGRNNFGNNVSSGIYIYKLQSVNQLRMKKMILVR